MGWLLFIAGWWWVLRHRDLHLRRILLIAYGLRAILALEHHFFFPLPDSQADALTFIHTAALWSQKGPLYLFTHVGSNAWFYVWILSWGFLFFGLDPFLAQMINVLLGTALVKLIHRASSLLWGTKISYRAAWLAAIFPLLVLYSAITMRESLMLWFFTWGLVGWIKALDRPRWSSYGQALIGFFMATVLHTAMIWGLAVVFLQIGALLMRRVAVGKMPRFGLAAGGLSGVLSGVMIWRGWGLDYVWGIARGSASPVRFVASMLSYAAKGRAVYLPSLIPRSWFDLLWMTPVRMLGFLFAPLWSFRGAKDLLAVGVALLWLGLLGLVLRTLFRRGKSILRRAGWLMVVFFLMWAMLSLGVSNYGTAIRHSLKLLPLCFVMVPYPRLLLWRHGQGREEAV